MIPILALLALSSGVQATAPVRQTDPDPATGFLFKAVKVGATDYRYVVYVPRDYDASRKWPLIVFLHGAGECGTEGVRQVSQGLGTAILANPAKWPFIVVMPQKPDVKHAWEDHDVAVIAMLDTTIAAYSVASERVYLTGLSQGGHGAWAIGARHPDRWAAIAPICGYGNPEEIAAPLKAMPIWCFHGEADTVVPPARSTAILDALKALGATPKYTAYPGVGHNSWDKAYRDEPLAAWFLENVRPPTKQ